MFCLGPNLVPSTLSFGLGPSRTKLLIDCLTQSLRIFKINNKLKIEMHKIAAVGCFPDILWLPWKIVWANEQGMDGGEESLSRKQSQTILLKAVTCHHG